MRKYYLSHREERLRYARERYNKLKNSPAFRLKQKIRQKKLYQKLKMEVLIYYGGNPPKCACCGESHVEFLSIDHIKDEGNVHRRKIGRGRLFYHWLIKNNFPKGYQVLCRNCNWAKSHGGCPHKEERE